MTSKMKKILASVTLSAVAIACVPVVNAASSVSGNVDGYSCRGTLRNSSDAKPAATASTSYNGYNGAVYTEVSVTYGFGEEEDTAYNSASNNRGDVIATATSPEYGAGFLSATGHHEVMGEHETWSDDTSIYR